MTRRITPFAVKESWLYLHSLFCWNALFCCETSRPRDKQGDLITELSDGDRSFILKTDVGRGKATPIYGLPLYFDAQVLFVLISDCLREGGTVARFKTYN